MTVKWLILFVIVILFISGCSVGDKTKAVVTDAGEETQEQEPSEEDKQVKDEKETVDVTEQESEEESKLPEEENETGEDGETELNESQEEEQTEESPPGTHTITIKDLKLDPQELTIKKGDTVVWKHEDKWEDNTQHYLAAHSNEFRSPLFYYGEEFEHTFDEAGTFTYFDVMYKERNTIRGTIIVTE